MWTGVASGVSNHVEPAWLRCRVGVKFVYAIDYHKLDINLLEIKRETHTSVVWTFGNLKDPCYSVSKNVLDKVWRAK